MPPIIPLLFLILHSSAFSAGAPPPLKPGFYSKTCPDAEIIVRGVLQRAMARETRSVASILRFQFHDCFVNGCDGSLLLDDTADMVGEKSALSNINSLRSYEVVDEIKEALERACPGVVSCADIIIMAARDAVGLSGGPHWEVKLGRLDSLTASQEASNNIIPSPRADAGLLTSLFNRFNLTTKDLVALSGAHSIGSARCFSIVHRLYNQSGTGQPDPTIEEGFRKKLERLCPLGGDEEVVGNLDGTPTMFDNRYFKDLVDGKGFLNSDQTLFTHGETRSYVEIYSKNQSAFFEAFVEGMIRMGDLQTRSPGEIRRDCRKVNHGKVEFLLENER